jgi:hypothetical protein
MLSGKLKKNDAIDSCQIKNKIWGAYSHTPFLAGGFLWEMPPGYLRSEGGSRDFAWGGSWAWPKPGELNFRFPPAFFMHGTPPQAG